MNRIMLLFFLFSCKDNVFKLVNRKVQNKCDMEKSESNISDTIVETESVNLIIDSGGSFINVEESNIIVEAESINLIVDSSINVVNAKAEPTNLIEAVINGNIEQVIIYIEQQNDKINCQDEHGKTALMYAAKNGNEEIVRSLIEAGANIRLKDSERRTALSIAKIADKQKCIKQLEKAEKDIELINRKNEILFIKEVKKGNICLLH